MKLRDDGSTSCGNWIHSGCWTQAGNMTARRSTDRPQLEGLPVNPTIMFWRPWFAPYFPIDVIRLASLLHAVAAVVLILSVIVHVYAAIWVKGTIRAMTRGTVTESWAKASHAAWYQEVSRGK